MRSLDDVLENEDPKVVENSRLGAEEILLEIALMNETALMNEAKELAVQCGALVEKLRVHPDTDKRSIAIAKTELQTGFMWAIRGIARPETF